MAYIHALEVLDARNSFRFLDLLPELRNMVYSELLTIKEEDGKGCWPQILATCKQVHQEAEGIFHADTQVEVETTVALYHYPSYPIKSFKRCYYIEQIHKKKAEGYWEMAGEQADIHAQTPMEGVQREFGGKVLKARDLTVKVELYHPRRAADTSDSLLSFAEANHLLYSLASAIGSGDSKRLYRLKVVYEAQDGFRSFLTDTGQLHDFLRPLVKFGRVENVAFEGVPLEVEARLRESMVEGNRATRSLLDAAHIVRAKAETSIAAAVDEQNEVLARKISRAVGVLALTMRCTGLMTEAYEWGMKRDVTAIEELLDGDEVRQLMRTATEKAKCGVGLPEKTV